MHSELSPAMADFTAVSVVRCSFVLRATDPLRGIGQVVAAIGRLGDF